MKRRALIEVDLGPNLSVTGSLAILWLIALGRESENITTLLFLEVGLFERPQAYMFALAALLLTAPV